MSGIEEILGLVGAGSGAAGAGGAGAGAGAGAASATAAGTAAAAPETGLLTGTGMMAPATAIPAGNTAAGGIAPATGMLDMSAGAGPKSDKAVSQLMGGMMGGDGSGGKAAMDLLKIAASRPGANAPAAMYPPGGARGGGGKGSAAQFLQMLQQRPKPKLAL